MWEKPGGYQPLKVKGERRRNLIEDKRKDKSHYENSALSGKKIKQWHKYSNHILEYYV